MKLLQALRNLSEKLNAEFEDSKLFEHSGEKGEFREQIISNLLRPFLPDCYGLGSGQIFSQDDESSNQIDIVIYDAIYSNVLFKNKSTNLFPAESVYGEIEVKSNLTTNELISSIDNIASMKRLIREDSTMLNITPVYKLTLGGPLSASTNKLNNYLGIIYAYDGLSKETFFQKLSEKLLITDKSHMPDFIFNQRGKYMSTKVKQGKIVFGVSDFDGYSLIDTKEDTLPLMFTILNACLNTIRLQAPNYNNYLNSILQSVMTK